MKARTLARLRTLEARRVLSPRMAYLLALAAFLKAARVARQTGEEEAGAEAARLWGELQAAARRAEA